MKLSMWHGRRPGMQNKLLGSGSPTWQDLEHEVIVEVMKPDTFGCHPAFDGQWWRTLEEKKKIYV